MANHIASPYYNEVDCQVQNDKIFDQLSEPQEIINSYTNGVLTRKIKKSIFFILFYHKYHGEGFSKFDNLCPILFFWMNKICFNQNK